MKELEKAFCSTTSALCNTLMQLRRKCSISPDTEEWETLLLAFPKRTDWYPIIFTKLFLPRLHGLTLHEIKIISVMQFNVSNHNVSTNQSALLQLTICMIFVCSISYAFDYNWPLRLKPTAADFFEFFILDMDRWRSFHLSKSTTLNLIYSESFRGCSIRRIKFYSALLWTWKNKLMEYCLPGLNQFQRFYSFVRSRYLHKVRPKHQRSKRYHKWPCRP